MEDEAVEWVDGKHYKMMSKDISNLLVTTNNQRWKKTRPPDLREASSINISRKIFEISRKIFEISRYNITNKTVYYFFWALSTTIWAF